MLTRYACTLVAAILAITASAAHAQGPMAPGDADVVAPVVHDSGRPAPLRRSTNPYPPATEALRVRLGCTESDAFEAERGRFRSDVRVGMDACVALARYGQPSSVTISDFEHTELVTMVWGNRGGSYGVHVAAVTYKDHPLTHQAGKQDEIGRWRITRLFGTERR